MTVWAQLQVAVSCGDPGGCSYDFIRSRAVLLLKHIRTYYLMTHGILPGPGPIGQLWLLFYVCLYPEVSLHQSSSPGYVYPYREFCGLAWSVKWTACRLGEVPATLWNVCAFNSIEHSTTAPGKALTEGSLIFDAEPIWTRSPGTNGLMSLPE